MYKNRIEKLRKSMKNKDIDGVLLIGDYNRNYMSGFTGDESFSVITNDRSIFITDSRFTEQARQEVKNYEIMQYNKKFPLFLGELVKELNINKLGFEEDVVTVNKYNEFKNNANVELVPLEGMVEAIRIVKDNSEIECIKNAAGIADKAFLHMLKFIKAGMTEREIGIELEFSMKKLGAKALSFPSIVASGKRSCLPHGQATDKVVEKGDFLTLDFGCVFDEYCSDMTRTIVIGEASDKMKEIYNVVLEAQKKALKAIKAGVKGKDVDKVARDVIKAKGYGEYFGHGLGHGVGRYIHEGPAISPRGELTLKAGMIITDEPGIYIPDFAGVRIEDLILVTEDGCEVISKSPKELISI